MEGKKKLYCKFPACRNTYKVKGKNKHFFHFPRDSERLQQWMDVCQISNASYRPSFVVCEDHFFAGDFINERKVRLNLCAVPSVLCEKALCDTAPTPDLSKNSIVEACATLPCIDMPSTSSVVPEHICPNSPKLGEIVEKNQVNEKTADARKTSDKCALRDDSPHWNLWSKLLSGMDQWKLINLESGADCTGQYSFIGGWQTTIRSIMYLWHHLKNIPDFSYFNLRSLNQDPLENLFCSIRQHGICNTNPTCHQFTAALKTVMVNNLASPTSEGNCEKDACTPLEDLGSLLQYSKDDVMQEEDTGMVGPSSQPSKPVEFVPTEEHLIAEDTQGLAYVAGYLLKQIDVPDCDDCRKCLYAKEVLPSHTLTSFRECDAEHRLTYPCENVMLFVQNIHDNLYKFLEANGHQLFLEDKFKQLYKSSSEFSLSSQQPICEMHDCEGMLLDKCTRFFIFKYVREKHKQKKISKGHVSNIKKLRSC